MKVSTFFPIALLSLSAFTPLAIAQSRECPPEGYYGAMSLVCPPPARTVETWEANELQKRIQTHDNETQIVCVQVPGWRNDETDVADRCRRVSRQQR